MKHWKPSPSRSWPADQDLQAWMSHPAWPAKQHNIIPSSYSCNKTPVKTYTLVSLGSVPFKHRWNQNCFQQHSIPQTRTNHSFSILNQSLENVHPFPSFSLNKNIGIQVQYIDQKQFWQKKNQTNTTVKPRVLTGFLSFLVSFSLYGTYLLSIRQLLLHLFCLFF